MKPSPFLLPRAMGDLLGKLPAGAAKEDSDAIEEEHEE